MFTRSSATAGGLARRRGGCGAGEERSGRRMLGLGMAVLMAWRLSLVRFFQCG